MPSRSSHSRWGAELAHPVPIAAIALLALNDHVLKHAAWCPRLLSGKLSDVCGLFFFPILLFAIAGGRLRYRGRARVAIAIGSALLTGAVFAALKLSPAANALVAREIAMDATDLAALPALVLSVLWIARRELADGPLPPRWARAASVLFAAGASVATSPARNVRLFPVWNVVGGADAHTACADLHAWASKSGKQGAGVTVRITGRASCSVAWADARFDVAGQSHPAIALPPPTEVSAGSVAYAYLGFSFDGDDVWSRGVRDATVVIRASAGGEPATLDLRMKYVVEPRVQPSPPPPPPPSASALVPVEPP